MLVHWVKVIWAKDGGSGTPWGPTIFFFQKKKRTGLNPMTYLLVVPASQWILLYLSKPVSPFYSVVRPAADVLQCAQCVTVQALPLLIPPLSNALKLCAACCVHVLAIKVFRHCQGHFEIKTLIVNVQYQLSMRSNSMRKTSNQDAWVSGHTILK